MNKLSAFIVGATALLGAQAANAATYTPPGTHVFSGTVTVQKDGSPYTCTLTVNVNAATTSATATASLSGGFPCALISVTGTGTVSFTPADTVTITGLTITPPLSPGKCTGPINAKWVPGTPNKLVLTTPFSDSSATTGAPCKMVGTLTQTSTPPLVITP